MLPLETLPALAASEPDRRDRRGGTGTRDLVDLACRRAMGSTSESSPLHHVQDADNDGGQAWPLDTLCARDRSRRHAWQIQRRPVRRVSPCAIVFVATRPSVPPGSNKVERAAEEVSHQVGVTMTLLVQLASASRGSSATLPAATSSCPRMVDSRRSHRIRVLTLEHLRELDLPVERRKRRVGMPPLLEPAAVALGLAADNRARVLALALPPAPSASLPRRTPPAPDPRRAAPCPARTAPRPTGRAAPSRRRSRPASRIRWRNSATASSGLAHPSLSKTRLSFDAGPSETPRSASARARRASPRAAARGPRR